ncbi:MAG: TetR/AcrR family transcriptional regulator [Actinobacteria bacterium]|nr:TetR/AcrR family transcriptional regulator [Actinomycetota bacterium]
MPKVLGGSLAAHRELTLGRIYAALGRLLGERGYDALTLADVAEGAGLARTAMYNYFADKEALLVGYAAHETAVFVARLDAELRALDNPVDQLRAFVRLQLEYVAANHLPPGPALRVLLPESAADEVLAHVGVVEERLLHVLRAGRDRRYLQVDDLDATAAMISACTGRAGLDAPGGVDRQTAVDATEAFVLRAVGARFGADGRPRRLPRR